jgi:hypothetical protein
LSLGLPRGRLNADRKGTGYGVGLEKNTTKYGGSPDGNTRNTEREAEKKNYSRKLTSLLLGGEREAEKKTTAEN